MNYKVITGSDKAATSTPLLSILTPAYNVNFYIEEMFESVRQQVFRDFEHVILNDGSDDNGGTIDYIIQNADARHTRSYSREHKGLFSTHNDLLRLARGKFITFLHADDLIHDTGALERAMGILQNETNIDVLYGKALQIDNESKVLPVQRDFVRNKNIKLLKHYFHFMFMGSMFVRRDVLTRTGIYFDEKFRSTGDWDWVYRISKETNNFKYSDDKYFKYRVHARSVSRVVGSRIRKMENSAILKKTGGSILINKYYKIKNLIISRISLIWYLMKSRDFKLLAKLVRK